MGAIRIGALVVTLACARAALAQAPPPSADPAWDRYHAAFLLLAEGDRDRAAAALAELRARFPGHPAAAQAEARLVSLGRAPSSLRDEPPIADPLRQERPTGGARAELILFQTIHGAVLAGELCAAFQCDDARLQAAIGMAGVGTGLAASYFLTKDGITAGHTEVLDSGVIWGAWNGLLINDLIAGSGDDIDRDVQRFFTVLAASQLAGLGAGELLWRSFRPTSAHVATANTAGFWTTILTLMAFGIAESEPDLTAVVIAGDLGLAAGALVASRKPMSRGRTYLVDAGGVVGVLVGLLVGVGSDDASTGFAATFAGTTVGLVAAIYLTRDWDDRPRAVPNVGTLTLVPLRDGGLAAGWMFPLDL